MACHLSIFAAFLLVSTTTFVSAKTAKCTIGGQGVLTMFNDETATVKIPCKYRMAEFDCSGFEVKVTPGSDGDGGQFSPVTVWVKLTELASGNFYIGRTSKNRIQEHIANNSKPVWDKKVDSTYNPDKEDYLNNKEYARLLIEDKVKVTFATSGNYAGVTVKCTYDSDADFVSKDYPNSLCGNISSTNVIASRKDDPFNDASVDDAMVILYDALLDTSVEQPSECKDAAEEFQQCQNPQTDSIQTCGPIFTDTTLAGCLIKGDNKIGRFDECMKLACKNNMPTCFTKLEKFKTYVDDKCGEGTHDAEFSALSCP